MPIKNIYSTTKTAQEGVLFGIGNPLLDISAETDTSVLEKYSLDANSQILCEEKHVPLYDDLIKNFDVQYFPGGASQNTCRAVQWALQNHSESKGATVYTGSVGDDQYCKTLTKAATDAGVNVKYYFNTQGKGTGTCAVVITDTVHRSLVANLDGANVYSKTAIDEVWKDVEAAQYYYSSGFFLTTDGGPTAIEKIGKYASAANKTNIMNLSAPFLPAFFKEQLALSISYADIVFGNENEAGAWAENNGMAEHKHNLKEIALAISNLPKNSPKKRMVVLTNGPKCTVIAQDGVVDEYPVNVIPTEDIVDTNGAGDAYVAGFICGLMYNKSIAECAEYGNYVATAIIKMAGATFPEGNDLKL